MNNKRRTFTERIGTPILAILILHTVIVVTVTIFLMVSWGHNFIGGWVTLMVMSLIIGICSALFFARILKRHISQILSFTLSRITNSGSSASSRFMARDEDAIDDGDVGAVYSIFSEVSNNLHTLQMDIGAMADSHLKGVYSASIDEGKYKGGALETVRRVNQMTSMYVDDYIELLEAVKSYSGGDFTAKVREYEGDWEWANDVVSRARDDFESMKGDF